MNVNLLTKKEILKRSKFRCIHGHDGFSHRRCYESANGIVETVGVLDIETSGFGADFAMVYSFCIKEVNGPLIKRVVDLDDMYRGLLDKNLIAQFIEDAKGFDRFIVHYGGDYRFDIPFLRTRAVKWGLSFPEYKTISLSDTYAILKAKFKLGSNRLGNACKTFNISAKDHPLNQEVWMQMMSGNPKLRKKALDYILTHNIEDVLSTEELWKRICPYVRLGKVSI